MNRHPCKFGLRTSIMKRSHSEDWELPTGQTEKFAQIEDTPEKFTAKINLSVFTGYKPSEIQVGVYGNNIQINCRKEDAANPNQQTQLQRQYRLPDDTDMDTLQMKRNDKKGEVTVDAEKGGIYGKAVKLNVVDVNKEVRPTRIVY